MKKFRKKIRMDWDSLFNEVLAGFWEDNIRITQIRLGAKGNFPFKPLGKHKTKGIMFYDSDFGTYEIKLDKRLKGEEVYLEGEDLDA